MAPRKAHWWRHSEGKLNYGDELNEYVLKVLGVEHEKADPADADLVVIGSVLEHLTENWTGTVAGAGQLFEHSRVDLSQATVLALRGKLTRERVRLGEGAGEPVLGDPALLVPHWIRQFPAQYDLGVVPHWSDTTLAERFPYAHVINPNDPPTKVITQIAQCKRIISSSLHGIIIADAYGIPRQAELFPNAHAEGGDFKFRDYASIYDDHPHFGEMWTAPRDVVLRVQRELRRVLHVLAGKVGDFFDEVEDAVEDVVHDVEDWFHHLHHHPDEHHPDHHTPQVSLLVPFRDNGEHRTRSWRWLREYWKTHLPSAEIILGSDVQFPFSKAAAVNEAAERARGRVFVILDADAYMDATVLQSCIDQIDNAVKAGRRLWYMPYNHLYRLSEVTTLRLLETSPTEPYSVPSPPPESWREIVDDTHSYGHKFGAMVQVMPREAFFLVGGMDDRFRGWGGEDVSFLRALDTLYCQHEVATADLCHFWHERPGDNPSSRHWIGQVFPTNSRLAQRYALAAGEPTFMRTLVDESSSPQERKVVVSSTSYPGLRAVDSSLAPVRAGDLPLNTLVVEVPFSTHAAVVPDDAVAIMAGQLPADAWVTPVV